MRSDSAVVTVHRGSSSYLRYVLHQTSSTCPNRPVVLLGDEAAATDGFQLVRLDDLASRHSRRFEVAYEHLSRHREGFERLCWMRWFQILEYMRRNDLAEIVHLDSDVLLYSEPLQIELTHIRGKPAALLVASQSYEDLTWAASGHVSYWTRAMLEEFCTYAIESFESAAGRERYREKWAWHERTRTPGGICDMTGLYLFWYDRQEAFANLAEERVGHCVDLSVNSGGNLTEDEYRTDRHGWKKIVMSGGFPHLLKNAAGTQFVRAHALHFQGRGKNRLPSYYIGNGLRVRRKLAAVASWMARTVASV